MLEALQVVGEAHDGSLGEVSSAKVKIPANYHQFVECYNI